MWFDWLLFCCGGFQSVCPPLEKNKRLVQASWWERLTEGGLGLILKEMEIPDHLTCLLRNLYAGQEAIVRTGHETKDWFQIGKGVRQGCLLSPCLFNLYEEYIMWNAGLDEAQARIKIARRNINNLIYSDFTTLMAEIEELKSLLMKVRGEWKSLLKPQHWKTKVIASGPIISSQIDRETMETVSDFIFGGYKVTADSDCSHEIKTLVPWKKSYDQPRQHIKNQRHYFVNKGPSSQGYVLFSSHVWMWELDNKESWVLKNWYFLNCGVGEDSWESLGLQGDQTSQS